MKINELVPGSIVVSAQSSMQGRPIVIFCHIAKVDEISITCKWSAWPQATSYSTLRRSKAEIELHWGAVRDLMHLLPTWYEELYELY